MAKRLERSKKIEIIWKINYQIFNYFLDYYREEKYWITFKESWDSAKWNTHDALYISEKALSKFLDDPTLNRTSKAENYSGKKGSRAFVNEHIIPFNILIEKYKERFKNKNPSFSAYKKFFNQFNKICFVWHDEDILLNKAGYKKEMPSNHNSLEENIFARYDAVEIKPIRTKFINPSCLFSELGERRNAGCSLHEVISQIIDN
jgi:hypothetical protein|tara:strand:+ start:73 stop:684 length:612 start_codon:yes stop_codon:yes gene_type:complete